MDIPQKDYDVFSDHQEFRKNHINLFVIFIIVGGLIAAALFINQIRAFIIPNRKQKTAAIKAPPEGLNHPAQKQPQDSQEQMQNIRAAITKAIEDNDTVFLSNTGAYLYYHGKTKEDRDLGVRLVETAEKIREMEISPKIYDPNQENMPEEAVIERKSSSDNWLSNRDKILTDYYKERNREYASNEKKRSAVTETIPEKEERATESYEERLRKVRQARIDTEKRTRRETTTERLRMGQDKAGFSTPTKEIRRPRKRIK